MNFAIFNQKTLQIYATFIRRKKNIIWILFQSINNVGFIPILFIINCHFPFFSFSFFFLFYLNKLSLPKWKSPRNICANTNPNTQRSKGYNSKMRVMGIASSKTLAELEKLRLLCLSLWWREILLDLMGNGSCNSMSGRSYKSNKYVNDWFYCTYHLFRHQSLRER